MASCHLLSEAQLLVDGQGVLVATHGGYAVYGVGCDAETVEQLRAAKQVAALLPVELDGSSEVCGRLLVREDRDRGVARASRVVDRLLDVFGRSCARAPVMRQLRKAWRHVRAVQGLQRAGDLAMEPSPLARRQIIVERLA